MIVAPFLIFLSATAATAVNHLSPGNQTLPESNVHPADKQFPESWIQEIMGRECPKAGDIPQLHLPDKRNHSVQAYIDKYHEVVGRRCDKNPPHKLHRRATRPSDEAMGYLGRTVNIGAAHFTLKTSPKGGPSILDRHPLPEECYTNLGGKLLADYATYGNSAYEYSDQMAASLEIETGIGAFGASVLLTAENKETLSKDVMYFRHDGQFFTEVVTFNSLCLDKYLNPKLKSALLAIRHQDLPRNDATHPGYLPYIALIERWGTHYVTTQQSGGSYELTMTSGKDHSSTASELAASFKASYLVHSMSVAGSKKSWEMSESAQSSVQVKVYGGGGDEMGSLKEAFENRDAAAFNAAQKQWIRSIEDGAVKPQKLDYTPLFPDVIEHVYADNHARQASFLANLKMAEKIVSRRAWAGYCLPAMWNEEMLECEVNKAVEIIGKWVRLLQDDRNCFYYNEFKSNIELKEKSTGPCSAFRYRDDGSMQVQGYEGTVKFSSGDTDRVSVAAVNYYADNYAKFRFKHQGVVTVQRGAAHEDRVSLYVKNGVLRLGPRPLDLEEEMYRFSATTSLIDAQPKPAMTELLWVPAKSTNWQFKGSLVSAGGNTGYIGKLFGEHNRVVVGEILNIPDGYLYASHNSLTYRERKYHILTCDNPGAIKWHRVHGKVSKANIPEGYGLFVAETTDPDVEVYIARDAYNNVGWTSSNRWDMELCYIQYGPYPGLGETQLKIRRTPDYDVMIVKLPAYLF